MSLKFSTGLRSGLMVTGSLKSLLDGGSVRVYAGAVPSSADAAIGAALLLCEIKVKTSGDGLTFEATAPSGVLTKNLSEEWESNNVASGDATFFRFVKPADTGGASTSEVRIQGTVGLAGADMQISNTALVIGAPQKLEYFNVAMPES